MLVGCNKIVISSTVWKIKSQKLLLLMLTQTCRRRLNVNKRTAEVRVTAGRPGSWQPADQLIHAHSVSESPDGPKANYFFSMITGFCIILHLLVHCILECYNVWWMVPTYGESVPKEAICVPMDDLTSQTFQFSLVTKFEEFMSSLILLQVSSST
jgi:hypothetical protein